MAPLSADVSSLENVVSHVGKGLGQKAETVAANQPFVDARYRNFFMLFSSFKVTNTKELIPALLIVFIFAVVATIVFHVLMYFERDTLARRQRMRALERLAAGGSFACRMTLLYVAVWFAMVRNLWVFLALFCGHLVGWVILSAQYDVLTSPPGEGEALSEMENVRKKQKQEDTSEDGSDSDSA